MMSLSSIASLSMLVMRFSSESILRTGRLKMPFDSSFRRLYTSNRNFGADFLKRIIPFHYEDFISFLLAVWSSASDIKLWIVA